LALKALEIPKNSIVLTTPFSFIASSSEIVAHGAQPVFIDIDKNTYNIDPQKIERWIEQETEQTHTLIHKKTGFPVVGILSVDIFGQCANYKEIKEIADKHNLWIIEDACQAVGAKNSQNQSAGTLGDISCFSFYPTKNLGAFGDGGACTTSNEYLAEKLLQLRNHGRKSHYNYNQLGINSRMDGIQAAVLNEKLKLIDEFNNKRNKIAQIYNDKLQNIEWLQLPKSENGVHVYHQYCIKINENIIDRSILLEELKKLGIGTNIYYPKTLDQIEFLNTNKELKTDCPIANNLSKTILALPIWPELELKNVEYICKCILPMIATREIIKETTHGLMS
ncbi:DegT/DnrJ/EryC1/StrS family aminotransferase, partial [Candidatus Dependentiae bacterium]